MLNTDFTVTPSGTVRMCLWHGYRYGVPAHVTLPPMTPPVRMIVEGARQ